MITRCTIHCTLLFTPVVCTNILHIYGLDSTMILFERSDIPQNTGNTAVLLARRILVCELLVLTTAVHSTLYSTLYSTLLVCAHQGECTCATGQLSGRNNLEKCVLVRFKEGVRRESSLTKLHARD